eukprot:scaffold1033_cov408-Prasinococcus_capsulatus_cf.AAC.34
MRARQSPSPPSVRAASAPSRRERPGVTVRVPGRGSDVDDGPVDGPGPAWSGRCQVAADSYAHMCISRGHAQPKRWVSWDVRGERA